MKKYVVVVAVCVRALTPLAASGVATARPAPGPGFARAYREYGFVCKARLEEL